MKPKPASEAPPQWYVVATRFLAKGDIIRKSDVTLVPQSPERRARQAYIRVLKETVGFELIRPLAAGQPVDAAALRRPILVRRNETITVVSRASGVRAQTTAKATENGSLGDLIMLQALTKGRDKYAARVAGHKHSEVYASGLVVSSPQQPPREFPSRQVSTRKLETVSP